MLDTREEDNLDERPEVGERAPNGDLLCCRMQVAGKFFVLWETREQKGFVVDRESAVPSGWHYERKGAHGTFSEALHAMPTGWRAKSRFRRIHSAKNHANGRHAEP